MKVPIALALTISLHEVPAAGAGSPCETKVQSSASRVKAAASALTQALGPEAKGRASEGARAALYALAASNCSIAAAAMGTPGYPGAQAVCVSAGLTAEVPHGQTLRWRSREAVFRAAELCRRGARASRWATPRPATGLPPAAR